MLFYFLWGGMVNFFIHCGAGEGKRFLLLRGSSLFNKYCGLSFLLWGRRSSSFHCAAGTFSFIHCGREDAVFCFLSFRSCAAKFVRRGIGAGACPAFFGVRGRWMCTQSRGFPRLFLVLRLNGDVMGHWRKRGPGRATGCGLSSPLFRFCFRPRGRNINVLCLHRRVCACVASPADSFFPTVLIIFLLSY